MGNRLSVLLLCAAVVSGVGAFAQAPPGTGQSDRALATDAAQSTPAPSTTLRMRGTINKYEASTRMLSLSTSNGTVQFPLASVARIRRSGQTVDASELAKLSEYRAAVRYAESGGNKTVESVHVFGKSDTTQR